MVVNERLVLVTGAAKGVGAATVLALMDIPDVRVIAVSRSAGLTGSRTHEERVEHLRLDLLDADACSRITAHVGDRRLHALVHNAGVLHRVPMGEYRRSDLERVFATNVLVPLELTQALMYRLEGEPPGHIVHIGSMGGFQDSIKFPGLAAYSSSKAALACMAQSMAEEFKDRGIRSNCLALGSVDTDMLREAFPGYRAATSASEMGVFVADFALNGHKLFNGKVLPVAMSTP